MTDELPGLARYIDAVSAPVELSEVIGRRSPRRPRRVVAVAFVAVVAAALAVVALVPRTVSEAPPGSTPATSVTTFPPTPVDGDARTASATAGQPAFLSSTEGWICGAPLRFTTDGGATWSSISVGSPDYAFDPQCAFASGGRAWIAMHDSARYPIPTIVQIIAGSQSKVTAVPLPGADEHEWIRSLAFADAQHGWATTNVTNPSDGVSHPASGLYRTTDGGAHWERILSRPPVAFGLRFTSPTIGWGIDDRPTLQRTDDGGRTWRTVPIVAIPTLPRSPIGGGLVSVFPTGSRIVLVGFVPIENFGQLFFEVSNDDGEHWSLQRVSTDIIQPTFYPEPWEFVALDATHWRVAADTTVAVTDDGGRSWDVRSTQLAAFGITGISFVTPDIGWAVDCNGDLCKVAHTTDAGNSWRLLDQP